MMTALEKRLYDMIDGTLPAKQVLHPKKIKVERIDLPEKKEDFTLEWLKGEAIQLSKKLMTFVEKFSQIASTGKMVEEFPALSTELGKELNRFYFVLKYFYHKGAKDEYEKDYTTYFKMLIVNIIGEATRNFEKYLQDIEQNPFEAVLKAQADFDAGIFVNNDGKNIDVALKYCGLHPVFDWMNGISDAIYGLTVDEGTFTGYAMKKYDVGGN